LKSDAAVGLQHPRKVMGISCSASRHIALLICSFFLAFSIPAQLAHAQAEKRSVSYEEKKRQTNDIAVTIVTSGLTCTCARFAEDIRNVVNDLRPDGLRVLPILGVGGLQNLNDVLFLKGIDMGVVDEDNLRLLKKRDPKLYANIEQRVQYITKLYNSEFHVVARDEIKSYDDLRGKKVNFNLKDSQTEVTADIIFNMLNIDVQRSNYDNDEAIKKLRDGEISAMIILTGAPQAALAKLRKEDGVHFLPLDQASLPGHDVRPILENYMAGEITHEHYPALIAEGTSVPTIANRALLIAYSWPERSSRYRRLAKFVHEFFERIYEFHDSARHPKWKDVNLAQEIPGWKRFKPAADWLARHRNPTVVASGDGSSGNLKLAFEQFIENYVATTGQKALSAREREALFIKFEQFLKQQSTH
jgi:TRAP transporter TAXI family solute receptor